MLNGKKKCEGKAMTNLPRVLAPCPSWSTLSSLTTEQRLQLELHVEECVPCQTRFAQAIEEAERSWLSTAIDESKPLLSANLEVFPELHGYQIIERIGYGGQGIVYLAKERALDRLVAIKHLRWERLASEQDKQRLLREARASARLEHSGIVRVYSVGEQLGIPYIVMEHLKGGTLSERLQHGDLSTPEAAMLLMHIANAVQFAHENQTIHRDLKPSNVLFVDNAFDQPKIADFGIAKRVTTEQSNITPSGHFIGTPRYVAPEIISNPEKLSVQADIYSLGAIFYLLLSGRELFAGLSDFEAVLYAATSEPKPPSEFRSDIPKPLEQICLHCLERDPSLRYQTAKELVSDLEAYFRQEPISLSQSWKFRKSPGKFLKPSRFPLMLCLILGVGLVCLRISPFGTSSPESLSNEPNYQINSTDYSTFFNTNVGVDSIKPMIHKLNDISVSESEKKNIAIILTKNSSASIDLHNEIESVVKKNIVDLDSIEKSRHCSAILARLYLAGLFQIVRPYVLDTSKPTLASIILEQITKVPEIEQIDSFVTFAKQESNPVVRRWILLSISKMQFPSSRVKPIEHEAIRQIHKYDPDSAVHSAAEYLLLKWNRFDFVQQNRDSLRMLNNTKNYPVKNANWIIGPERTTMCVIPSEAPDKELPFAIALHETSMLQYEHFMRSHPEYTPVQVKRTGEPIVYIPIHHIRSYCCWLSGQDGLEPCYIYNSKSQQYEIHPDRLKRNGYRLPTITEWKRACQGGSQETYSFGRFPELMELFGNCRLRTIDKPMFRYVCQQMPNQYGLFDMYGNASELCEDSITGELVICGGSNKDTIENAGGVNATYGVNVEIDKLVGFRVVRSLPKSD